jgi:two-component system phosphate regulon sensor histidine kinase PhoR
LDENPESIVGGRDPPILFGVFELDLDGPELDADPPFADGGGDVYCFLVVRANLGVEGSSVKLEKAIARPKTGLYVIVFIVCLAIAGVMATSYNVEIILNNLRENVRDPELPWLKIVLGSLGFLGIIMSLSLFFARMIREMKMSQFHADFLDRVSHELRTPLATLTLVSDLLKSGHELSTDERARLWKSHGDELDRLKVDVESLLQAARLRESRQQVHAVDLPLGDFVREKWSSFQSLLGPGAQMDFVESQNVVVHADPQLMELMIRNLLDNAKKFALGTPRVVIRIGGNRRRFELSVSDQGRGFAPQEKKQLFRRFSRLESFRSGYHETAIPGTGLGLYLSASAAKAMKMTLEGSSPGEGRGATFILSGKVSRLLS